MEKQTNKERARCKEDKNAERQIEKVQPRP